MSRQPVSLVSKMTVANVLLMAGVILLATVFFIFMNNLYTQHMIQRTLSGYSKSLTEHLAASGDIELARFMARNHRVAMIVTWKGRTVAFDTAGEPTTPKDLRSVRPPVYRVDHHKPGMPQVSYFWSMEDRIEGQFQVFLIHLTLLALFIGGTWLFQRKQLKPLRWLRAGVEAVARGDFKTRVPVVRRDEIGQVAEAFNEMTERVDRMIHDRERLLGDVSHELRSPLARIKVALALLPEDGKHRTIARNVEEMQSLITVLLERERISAMTDALNRNQLDLKTLAEQVTAAFGDRKPGVVSTIDGPVEVEADEALMTVLLRNLVDNGLKFSAETDQPVVISAEKTETHVRLSVSDSGPGIPPENVERIFEAFVKLDPARGHGSGYGLGLNLCKRIVDAHGGTIAAGPNGERGTEIRVSLPG
ncbi:MAG: HAMP domain-containing sensor histidine kinase [Acidobacteriota bacterium]|nr:HAMP domain-containing sensor histidine kinase [Acidobacteriota bacterium]